MAIIPAKQLNSQGEELLKKQEAIKEYEDKNFSTVKQYKADNWEDFTEQLEKEGHTNISPVFHLSSQKK